MTIPILNHMVISVKTIGIWFFLSHHAALLRVQLGFVYFWPTCLSFHKHHKVAQHSLCYVREPCYCNQWVWHREWMLLLIKCYKPATNVLYTMYQRGKYCVFNVLKQGDRFPFNDLSGRVDVSGMFCSQNNRTTHLWPSMIPLSQALRHIWLRLSGAEFFITSWLWWGRGGQS